MDTPTVFVVDGDEDSLFVLGELLESEGLRPRLFRHAEDAAQALASAPEPPHLLLLDTMTPGTPGAALLETIRGDERWCGIPAIVFTAWNDVAAASGFRVPSSANPTFMRFCPGSPRQPWADPPRAGRRGAEPEGADAPSHSPLERSRRVAMMR